jgi:hypothetical protein
MPEPAPEKPAEFADAKEAAEELIAERGPAEPDEHTVYFDATGEPADPNEVVTLERAADDMAAWRAQKAEDTAKSISADLAAEIDKKRAAVVKGDAKLAAEMGLEAPGKDEAKPKSEAAQNVPDDPTTDDPFDSIEGLDSETRAALKLPQVREAVLQQIASADQAREVYSTGLENARVHTLATLAEVVPHLAGLPPQQFEHGLAMLAQVDPPAFEKAMNVLARTNQIVQAQQQEQQRQAHARHQEFEAQRQRYSKASDEALGSMTRAEKMEMGEELVAYLGENGISREQLRQEAQSNLAIHHPAFQRMAVDALMYRRQQSAKKAVASKPLPPVARPGAPQPRGSSSSSEIQNLQRQLSTASGHKAARISAKILSLERASR